jgi:hypothetical protein
MSWNDDDLPEQACRNVSMAMVIDGYDDEEDGDLPMNMVPEMMSAALELGTSYVSLSHFPLVNVPCGHFAPVNVS